MQTQPVFRTEEGRKAFADFEDNVLAQWPFDFSTATVSTRFGKTFTVTAGDRKKPALLMLHGSASCLLGWGADIPNYMDRFYVIAPDIPGEPGRSEPVRPSWDNDDYVQWLCDILDSLGIKEVILQGISLGGWIALKFAAVFPERVKKLVLTAPAGIVPARRSAIFKMMLYAKQKDGLAKTKRLVFGTDEILLVISEYYDLVQEHYVPWFGSPPVLSDEAIRGIQAEMLMVSGD